MNRFSITALPFFLVFESTLMSTHLLPSDLTKEPNRKNWPIPDVRLGISFMN
jgi:hypothetical protein